MVVRSATIFSLSLGATGVREVNPSVFRARDRVLVARLGVPYDSHSGVARQDALESLGSLWSSIGDDHHSRVEAHAHSHATAVVKADPARAGRRVDERVQ